MKRAIVVGNFSAVSTTQISGNKSYGLAYEQWLIGNVDSEYYNIELDGEGEVAQVPLSELPDLIQLINECKKELEK